MNLKKMDLVTSNKLFAGLFPKCNTRSGSVALLTKRDVMKIFLNTNSTLDELSEDYHVSRSTIDRIKKQTFGGNTLD